MLKAVINFFPMGERLVSILIVKRLVWGFCCLALASLDCATDNEILRIMATTSDSEPAFPADFQDTIRSFVEVRYLMGKRKLSLLSIRAF